MGHDTIWCIGRGYRLDDGGRAIESMWPLFKHDRFQFMSMHIPREQVTMKAIAGGTLFHVHVSVPVLPLRPVAGASSVALAEKGPHEPGSGHVSSSCGYPKCSTCNGSHHKILCVKQSDYINSYDHSRRRSRERYRSTESNRSRSPEGYSRSPSYDGRRPPTPVRDRSQSPASRWSNTRSPSYHERSTEYSTFEAQTHPKTRQLQPVILLLDTGAQKSFISHSAVQRLQLEIHSPAPLTTITFGAVRTTEHSGIVDVILIDLLRKPLQLSVRTKNKITVPCPALHITPEDRDALQDLSIAPESITATRQVTPDILIGIDYFWDIVTTDPPHTLPSGLVLCYTRFGPSISGSQFFR
ncbi:Tas retrotransposon peptidase A16 [Ostertagia ostertagi]